MMTGAGKGGDRERAEDAGEGEIVSLYKAHEKVYPREVSGRFARLRVLAVWVLLGLYYALPWIPWDGRQAVLFDLPARKFHLFGLVFWPQDFFFLALLLIIAALSLFFFTALAGRLWCGYACPQTVWTEAFIWMERVTEGDRRKQMKLDATPWNREKFLRKGSKHLLWIAFAAWTGFTFVGFFTPITELGTRLMALSLGPWETFWIVFYGFATYGNAGFLREQVCIYMCPYARFQSAMFDRDTLIISYDRERGEPRGPRSRKTDHVAAGLGDCIDCTLCVQVCPTGIDIRDGLQHECIACAACVDACDQIMDRMGYPRGLIRYSTENEMETGETHVARPRIFAYGAVLLLLVAAWIYGVMNRAPLIVDVIRDRNALYQQVSEAEVENVFTVRLVNKATEAHSYRISVAGLPGIRIPGGSPEVAVAAGDIRSVAIRIRAPYRALTGMSHEVSVIAESADGSIRIAETARFLTPSAGAGS